MKVIVRKSITFVGFYIIDEVSTQKSLLVCQFISNFPILYIVTQFAKQYLFSKWNSEANWNLNPQTTAKDQMLLLLVLLNFMMVCFKKSVI